MIPWPGSAYTYTYATLGEFIAWIIAWDLILEYAVRRLDSGRRLVRLFHTTLLKDIPASSCPTAGPQAPFTPGRGFLPDRHRRLPQPAGHRHHPDRRPDPGGRRHRVGAGELGHRGDQGRGGADRDRVRLHPRHPGQLRGPSLPEQTVDAATGALQGRLGGVFAAAGVIFFAYIGFETVSTAGQETHNPQKNIPIAIIASVTVCTILYILMCLVVTGLAPYTELNIAGADLPRVDRIGPSPGLAEAGGHRRGHHRARPPSSACSTARSRIFYAMARDSLLPPVFAKVEPKRRTPVGRHADHRRRRRRPGRPVPHRPAGRTGLDGHAAGLRHHLRRGDLSAHQAARHRRAGSRCRSWQFTAPLGVLACLYLVFSLPAATWLRLVDLDGDRAGGLLRLRLPPFALPREDAGGPGRVTAAPRSGMLPITTTTLSGSMIAGAGTTLSGGRRRADRAAGRGQDHGDAAGPARPAVDGGPQADHAGAAAPRGPRRRRPHGPDPRRTGRQDRRLPRAHAVQGLRPAPASRWSPRASSPAWSWTTRRWRASRPCCSTSSTSAASTPTSAWPWPATRKACCATTCSLLVMSATLDGGRVSPPAGRRPGDREPGPRLSGRDPLSRPRPGQADRGPGGAGG